MAENRLIRSAAKRFGRAWTDGLIALAERGTAAPGPTAGLPDVFGHALLQGLASSSAEVAAAEASSESDGMPTEGSLSTDYR
jgi:hypothetical protein